MIASSLLQRAGFKHVINVVGGFDAWQQAKLPTVGAKPAGEFNCCPSAFFSLWKKCSCRNIVDKTVRTTCWIQGAGYKNEE